MSTGGNSNDHDFTVGIAPDGQSAQWLCFRGSCGFKGGVTVGGASRPAKLQTGGQPARAHSPAVSHEQHGMLSLHKKGLCTTAESRGMEMVSARQLADISWRPAYISTPNMSGACR